MTASPWQRAKILTKVLRVFAQMALEEMAEHTEVGVQVLTLSFYSPLHGMADFLLAKM